MAAREKMAWWLLAGAVFCLGCGVPIVYEAWDGVRAQQQSGETMLRVIEQGPNRAVALERLRQLAADYVAAIRRCRDRGGDDGDRAGVALAHIRAEADR